MELAGLASRGDRASESGAWSSLNHREHDESFGVALSSVLGHQNRASRNTPGPVELRMGFAVDVERYSCRSSPAKMTVQGRLLALLETVLDNMDLAATRVDWQATGDGVNVFLPVTLEVHRALPLLISAWADHLAADNQRCTDRLRLRMAVVVGPVCVTPLGFGGRTIVEVTRLLDSPALRRALRTAAWTDLAVLVSDQLHRYVVGEGYPCPNSETFQRRRVTLDGHRTRAWLWTAWH